MNRKLTGTTLLLLGVLLAAPSLYATITSFNVPTKGSISMVKVYWDTAATKEVTIIDWGSIIPGATVNCTVYIKNFGGAPVNVTLQAINWTTNSNALDHTASNYITFSDDISGQNVTAHFIKQAILSCAVSEDIVNTAISTFTFNIQVLEAW